MATVNLSAVITPSNVLTDSNTVSGITNKSFTSPTFVTPALGTPASGVVTNLTGTASININGTVGATTPTTVVATTVKASTTMGVGAATPSASGAGITFPATASLSTNANTLDDYQEGTYTGTFTGVTTTVTATITYVKTGGVVTLFIPSMSGTSNATTKTITGMPSILYPVTSNGNRRYPIEIVNNNSAQVLSMGNLTNAGVMNIYINPNNDAWTASGACSIGATSITYTVSS